MTMVERAAAQPDPNERLARVFVTEQESEALVVRGLLESAGIDCQLGDSENSPDVLLGAVGILVREEDAERARQLIAESQRSPAQRAAHRRILGIAKLAVNASRFEQAANHQRLAFLFRNKYASESFIRIGLSSSSFDHCHTSKFELRF